MILRLFKGSFKRSLKLSRYLVLGSSLISCSGTSHRPALSPQKQSQKRSLKLEMMSLWVKVEYSRLMGDEVQAKALERDLEILENELLGLETAPEKDVSLTSSN